MGRPLPARVLAITEVLQLSTLASPPVWVMPRNAHRACLELVPQMHPALFVCARSLPVDLMPCHPCERRASWAPLALPLSLSLCTHAHARSLLSSRLDAILAREGPPGLLWLSLPGSLCWCRPHSSSWEARRRQTNPVQNTVSLYSAEDTHTKRGSQKWRGWRWLWCGVRVGELKASVST